jgi:hypothetical protein
MYKNPAFELLLRDVMQQQNPSFFGTFDPHRRDDVDLNVIKSTLSEVRICSRFCLILFVLSFGVV